MSLRMRLHRTAGILGCLVLAAGMLLHVTVRDDSPQPAIFFYAMPLPLILVGWLITAAWHLRQRVIMGTCFALALLTACWWHGVSYEKEPRTATKPTVAGLKVLYWNMAHQRLPSPELERIIAVHQPDIVGLGEVGLRSGDPNPLIQNLPAGYSAIRPEHGMGFIVRGAAQVRQVKKLKGRSKFVELDSTVDGRSWHIILVDGDADPLLSREELLEKVLAQAQAPHTLVLGDFNTPLESQWFDPWRAAGLRHATEGERGGFRETWPRPWPILTIDHIWCTEDMRPLSMKRISLPSSDHFAVFALLQKAGRR